MHKKHKKKSSTVSGLGSKIFEISFFALVENQGGLLKSALNIWNRAQKMDNVQTTA